MEILKHQKKICLATVVILIMSLFSPYGYLINVSKAAVVVPNPVVVINRTSDITSKTNGKIFTVDIAVVGDIYTYGFDIKLKYDATKIEPARTNGAVATSITNAATLNGYFSHSTVVSKIDFNENTIRLVPSAADPVNSVIWQQDEGDGQTYGYTGYCPVYTMRFRLVDENLTEADLTTSLFSLSPIPVASPTGFKYSYDDGGTAQYIVDSGYLNKANLVEVEEAKVVVGVSVKTNPTKMIYNHGDTLDLTGGELELTYEDGSKGVVSMTDSSVSMQIPSDGKADFNNPQVTLKYGSFTASFTPNVQDPIDNIIFKTGPGKIIYNQGDTIDWSGAEIRAVSKTGVITDISVASGIAAGTITSDTTKADLTASNANITGTTSEGLDAGNQLITLTYAGKTASTTVLVNDTVTGVTIGTNPKTNYLYNEALDLSTGTVRVTTATGANLEIPMTDGAVSVTGYVPTTLGNQSLNVSFAGTVASGTLNITVDNYVKSITVNSPTKVAYQYGESLNLAGGSVIEQMADGTTGSTISLTDAKIQVTGYDANNPASQTLTVVYTKDGKTYSGTFTVSVSDVKDHLTITVPNKVTYTYGEDLDLTGAKVQVVMKSGTTIAPVNITSSMISGYSPTTIGPQTITVNYSELTATFAVTVNDVIDSITINKPTAVQEYKYGASLDFTGGNIVLHYVGGTADSTLPLNSATITETVSGGNVNMSPDASEFGADHTLTKNITLTYTQGGKIGTASYDIKIINDIQSISVQTNPTKLAYNLNETLDITGGEILVTRATGVAEVIGMENSHIQVTGFNSSAEKTGQVLTVSYIENGISKNTTFSVDIKDSVTAIELAGTPKSEYKYGEALESLNIKITKGSGQSTIPVTSTMISGYDANTIGTQTVTISYGGKTASFQVEVKDYMDHIEVTSPRKTTYNYGESLDLTGGTVNVIMASGTPTIPIALDDPSVQISNYDPTDVSTQTLMVTYQGKTATFSVTVKNDISSMTLKGTPKTDYEYGDEIDLTDLSIEVVRPSGTTNVLITDSKVEILGYDANTIGNQTVTIKYDGKVVTTVNVNVTNPITGIQMGTMPKTSYEIGDALDITGGTILVTRKDNSTQTVNITEDMVSGFDSSQVVTDQILTVKYTDEGKDYTTTYQIDVVEAIASIAIGNMPKQDYLYGDTLDIAGGTIIVNKSSGETETVTITASMVTEEDGSEFDSTNLTPRNLKISYGNKEITYAITVSDYIVDITLTTPNKVTYEYGENLDLTGGSITKVMASGTPTTSIALNDPNVEIVGFDNTQIGTQMITVNYKENGKTYSKQYSVSVSDPVSSITLDVNNVKKDYYYGDNLDLTNAKLIIEHLSGTTENIPVTSGMISGYNSKILGSQTVTVRYADAEYTFQVNVSDYIADIRLTPPTKVEYQYNEILDLSGGSITEVMASGIDGNTIQLSTDIITGFDSTTPGTKTILVNYTKDGKQFQKQFQVIVYNDVDRIEVISPDKTNYKYGEELNLVGGKIKTIREDGTEEYIAITKNMITGYQKTVPGRQVITVTYIDEKGTNFQGNFVVNVGEDYIKGYEFTAPQKKSYEIGELLDLTGGKFTEVYASGKKGNIAEITSDMITGFNSTTPGTKTIKILYQGKEYSYKITVKDPVLGITIQKTPDKLEYKKGEKLDITGGTLNVIKKSGTIQVPITKNMVSGFDKNKVGMQVVTVTYGGFTTQFTVNILKPSTTPSTGGTIVQPQVPPQEKPQEEPKDEIVEQPNDNQNQNTPPIGIVDNNNTPTPPFTDVTKGSWLTVQTISYLAAFLVGLLTLCIIILLYIRFKKNVKIYIEEGNERVLVGKARVTRDNRILDLSKYYDKYHEENYKVFVTESGTKKLDNKKLDVVVKDKVDTFKVKYQKDGCEYKV